MKKNLLLITMTALFVFGTVSAQNSTIERMKQRQELQKMNNKLQSTGVDKESKKQAKKDEKEGWKVAPGYLPLAQQYSRSSLLQNQFEDDLLTPKYVWGDATSTAENYDGGKMQAIELAQINMVSSIEKNITQIVDNNRDNKQLNAGNAATVVKSLAKAKTYISKRIGQTTPVIDTYRELGNGNVQVRVMIFYSMDKARELARDAIREQLEKDGEKVGEGELDQLLGWK